MLTTISKRIAAHSEVKAGKLGKSTVPEKERIKSPSYDRVAQETLKYKQLP